MATVTTEPENKFALVTAVLSEAFNLLNSERLEKHHQKLGQTRIVVTAGDLIKERPHDEPPKMFDL